MSPFQGQRRNCHVIWLKTAQRLFLILNTLGCRQLPCSGDLCSHNRLLRRQHCSSLCLQSEGHEHVANMSSVLGHNFVGFSSRAWPSNICPPHFASKVSYSASPQPFTKCPRSIPYCAPRQYRLSAHAGADTTVAGSRDERIWEQKRASLGAETSVAGTVCSCVCSCVRYQSLGLDSRRLDSINGKLPLS